MQYKGHNKNIIKKYNKNDGPKNAFRIKPWTKSNTALFMHYIKLYDITIQMLVFVSFIPWVWAIYI